MSFYVASRVRHAPMWRRIRDAEGVPIISTWIDEADEGATANFTELWGRIQREVTSAQKLVLYAEAEDFPFKGALVEVGMALAANVPVVVVLADGVTLEGRTLRPLGSWLRHPNVTRHLSLARAFSE